MIGLLFPKIEFSGRLGRGEFWREIALSIIWTPIVFATVGFLFKEAAVATSGIAGTGVSFKSLAGIAIFALGARNMMATLGVIKRRMNDLGYRGAGLVKVFWPIIGMLALLPFGLVLPILLVFHPILVVVQIFLMIRTSSDLFFGPSRDGLTTAPKEPIETEPFAEIGQRLSSVAADLVKRAHNIGVQSANQRPWAKPVFKQVQAFGEKLSSGAYHREAKQLFDSLSSGATPMLNKTKECERPRRERRARPKKAYQAPASQAVKAAHALPRHGRSSLLEGLLRGPWG